MREAKEGRQWETIGEGGPDGPEDGAQERETLVMSGLDAAHAHPPPPCGGGARTDITTACCLRAEAGRARRRVAEDARQGTREARGPH